MTDIIFLLMSEKNIVGNLMLLSYSQRYFAKDFPNNDKWKNLLSTRRCCMQSHSLERRT